MIKRGPNGNGIRLDLTGFVNLLITVIVIVATGVAIYYKTATEIRIELSTICTNIEYIKADGQSIRKLVNEHEGRINAVEKDVCVIKNEIGMSNR